MCSSKLLPTILTKGTMHLFPTVIFLVFSSALIDIYEASPTNDNSSHLALKVKIPEGKTVEQHVQDLTEFWTDERLKAAKPKSLIAINSLPTNVHIRNITIANETVKPTIIPATLPASFSGLLRPGYPNTVGKVFFVEDFDTYTCTASVVTHHTKDMILTAGHCVYSTDSKAFVTNFIFIPQYDEGSRPFGTWVARYLYAMSNWKSYGDLNSDVAIVLLNTSNSQHIQDVVGGQGISFNNGHSGAVSSFGYPRNYDSGETMTFCNATKYAASISGYTGDALSCFMNQGASGGPWFESFSSSALTGTQTSVNSFIMDSTPNVMYGPYFGSAVQSLYQNANTAISSFASKQYVFLTSALLLFHLAWRQQ